MTRKLATPRTAFGRRLRFARTEVAGLTQAQLAARSGVNRETIGRLESGGTVRAQEDTIDALASGLNVRGDFLRGTGDIVRPGMYFVYMFLDRTGRAIFVGICTNLPGQVDRHRKTSRWVREVAKVTHSQVQGYDAALRLRDRWVAEYVPVWNVQAAAEDQDGRTKLVRSVGVA